MVDLVAVVHGPLIGLLNGGARIPHIGHGIHQHTIAGGGAQRIHHQQLLLRILFLQHFRRQKSVVNGAGLAGGKAQMQHVAAPLQQLFKERHIFRHIDLGGLRQLACRQHFVEMRQSLRIAAHVVHIGHVIHHIGIKQNGNAAALQIVVRHIHGGAAAQCKVS